MENLTAKQLEEKIGFNKSTSIFIGEFQFIIYVNQDVNAKYGCGKLYIHIRPYTIFSDAIDLTKQYASTDSLEKDIRKQLTKLSKRINKALKEIKCKFYLQKKNTAI